MQGTGGQLLGDYSRQNFTNISSHIVFVDASIGFTDAYGVGCRL